MLLLIPSLSFAQSLNNTPLRTSLGWRFNGSEQYHSLSSATDAIEGVETADAGVITAICIKNGAKTGTSPFYKIGLVGVTTSTGRVNTTYKTGSGECSGTYQAGTDYTWQCVTLTGTNCTATRGELLGISSVYSSGTINGSNFAQIMSHNSGSADTPGNNYTTTVTAGTGTRRTNSGNFILRYGASKSIGKISDSDINYSCDNMNPGSGTDECGVYFRIQGVTGGTYTLSGFYTQFREIATGKTLTMRLYNTANTLLDSGTFYSDASEAPGSSTVKSFFMPFQNTTAPDLSFNTYYRAVIYTNTATTNLRIPLMKFPAAQDMGVMGLGTDMYSTRRVSAGAWTDDATLRPFFEPVIATINSSGGGGGGSSSTKGNLSGGYQ